MGRDVTGLRDDKKLNENPNEVTFERVHVAPKISNDEVEEELTVKSTNVDPSLSDFRAKIEAFKQKEKNFSAKPSPNASGIIKSSESPREMGRDATGLRSDEKRNKVSFERVDVAPKISNDEVEPEKASTVDHNQNREVNQEVEENKEVITPKSTNVEPSVSSFRDKIEVFKQTEKNLTVKPSPNASETLKPSQILEASESAKTSTPKAQSQQVAIEKTVIGISNNATEVKIDTFSDSPMSMKHDLHSQVAADTRQPHSTVMSRKPLQSYSNQRHQDEEDNYSLASSSWTTIRSTNFKPTVPIGPRFVCGERVARRKEYYKKLEDKQKALEAERLAEEARIKEKEEAELKKLRKSMAYKANPVPSFYGEGPPPKAKLKKFPLTRPKSPNLTRGKSCSDAPNSAQDENKSRGMVTRHSIGSMSINSKNKDRSGTRYGNTPTNSKDTNVNKKVKTQAKDTAISSPSQNEKMNTYICVLEHVQEET